MKGLVAGHTGNLVLAATPSSMGYIFPRILTKAIGGNTDVRVVVSTRGSSKTDRRKKLVELLDAVGAKPVTASPDKSAEA